MPRRVNLPGADELFRSTVDKSAPPVDGADDAEAGSGRVKHDEKMTIYVTSAELLAVEQARMQLRAELGRSVDRGRFVRAAIAVALADLDDNGTESDVARRLSAT